MKNIKLNILCFSILGVLILFFGIQISAQEICVFTAAKTNLETGSVKTTEIYTRDGMTNLICRTASKKGSVQIRIQRIYRKGKLLGEVDDDKINAVFAVSTEPYIAYSLDFEFASDRTLKLVAVGTNGVLVDAFTCTNGVLSPADSSKIKKVNEIGADVVDLFASTNVHGKSPGEFNRQVERLIKKHKDN